MKPVRHWGDPWGTLTCFTGVKDREAFLGCSVLSVPPPLDRIAAETCFRIVSSRRTTILDVVTGLGSSTDGNPEVA